MAAEALGAEVLALAGWIGANALSVFLVLLAFMLLSVALGWRVTSLHLLPRARSGLPQAAFVIASGLAGLAIVVGAATLFAEIAEQLGPEGAMSLADEALTASLQAHVSAATLRFFAAFTHFGDTATLTLLGAAVTLLLWLKNRPALALGWVLAVGGNALLNPLLKRIFERVRPLHEHGIVSEIGWSFPSGHTSGATVAYGMLAYLAVRTLPAVWHLPAVLAATALAFTVGCSRVFLQVHFASDVLAGFASGAAWLTVCIVSVEAGRYVRRRG